LLLCYPELTDWRGTCDCGRMEETCRLGVPTRREGSRDGTCHMTRHDALVDYPSPRRNCLAITLVGFLPQIRARHTAATGSGRRLRGDDADLLQQPQLVQVGPVLDPLPLLVEAGNHHHPYRDRLPG